MKTQLTKKLSAWPSDSQTFILLIFIGSMFFFSAAHAQIVYTNVKPDQTYTNGSYNLDLNNDGINDFTLTSTSSPQTTHCKLCGTSFEYNSGNITVQPLGNNKFGFYSGSSRLEINTLIDSNLSWSNNARQLVAQGHLGGECFYNRCIATGHSEGDWAGNPTDKYLGLKIQTDSQIYYGWIRLDMSDAISFTVKDYAYNGIPHSSILAGDKGSVATWIFSPENQNQFSVFPNPASDKIILSFSSAEKGTVQISNLLGQIVFSETVNSANAEIDVGQFTDGMYIVTLKTRDRNFESKFLKQ